MMGNNLGKDIENLPTKKMLFNMEIKVNDKNRQYFRTDLFKNQTTSDSQ